MVKNLIGKPTHSYANINTGIDQANGIEDTYSFDRCIVSVAKREVRVEGEVMAVAPRVFDLLLHLIKNRDRVVSKDDLLDIVWKGADLSASVIARAVMKARYAIGDRTNGPRRIRTIHRVGYRFVGPISEDISKESSRVFSQPTAPRPESEVAVSKLRIAVLPFQNLTGDSRLEWISLGLLSLVNQALEGDDRLHVASVSSVLKDLEDIGAAAEDETKARSLIELIGAQCICCAKVTKNENDFALKYDLVKAQGSIHTGKVVASEPTSLCELLVGSIEQALFGYEASTLRLHSVDPWVNQAFARAIQALELMNGESALKLIQVVLDVEPESLSARFKQLEAMRLLGLPEAIPLGKTILDLALLANDLSLASLVNASLAVSAFRVQGEIADSLRYADEAMRLAGPINDSYWVQRVYYDCASIAYYMGEHERAITIFEQVEIASRRTGNQKQWLDATASRGVIEAIRGNLSTARDLLEYALTKYDALNQKINAMTVRLNLSELSAATGLIDKAVHHCDMVANYIAASQLKWWKLNTISTLCIRFAEARRPDKIEHVLQVAELLANENDKLDLKHLVLAYAQLHASKGELHLVGKKLRYAIDLAVTSNDQECATQWVPLLLHNSMRAGRYFEAYMLAEELIAIPAVRDSGEISGMSLHARALELHNKGSTGAARAKLSEALTLMQPSRWSIHVRLDAAWLDIESGDLGAARRVLVGTFSWLQSHPIGQFVDARLQFAQGDSAAAVMAWERCSRFVHLNSAFASQLKQCYSLTDRSIDPTVPRIPNLPSVV